MLYEAAISKAYFTPTTRLARGPGSSLVSDLLADVAGRWVCVTEIEREDGRYTLILDADWAELGLQVSALAEADENNGPEVELPRPALLAVISGWPSDWDVAPNPTMGVHLSEDQIPHVSVSDIDALTDSADASATH